MFGRRRNQESGYANLGKAIFGRASMTVYLMTLFPANVVAGWAAGERILTLSYPQAIGFNAFYTAAYAIFAAIVAFNQAQDSKKK